jgi:RNA polymerase sigma-70 factor (sigma-E family)
MPGSRDSDFDDFVRARGTGLLRVAFLLTGDRHAAEDLLQEVLERMYVRWQHIRDAPEWYARRALVNRANSRWRQRRRRPEARLPDAAGPTAPDHADQIAGRESLVGALAALPARQRAAIVLRYLDDMSIPDTARALGCSEGAVKSHSARGLAKLRDVLDPTLVTGRRP